MVHLYHTAMGSVMLIGVTEIAPITSWERYLQGGALLVLAVITIIFMLKVLPTLLKQLNDQTIAFSATQVACAKCNKEGLQSMADAVNQLSKNCLLVQANLKTRE